MIVEPYLDGRVPDVVMIPIGISYERTLEEELFARELLGVPKPKESTGVGVAPTRWRGYRGPSFKCPLFWVRLC